MKIGCRGRGTPRLRISPKPGEAIAVYDGDAQFPENASAKDRELMYMPLISLALLGDTLYATDALKGRVLLYDKKSGELKKEIPVPLACGIAVEPSGKIWVGHEHGKVSVLSPEGKCSPRRSPISRRCGRSLRGEASFMWRIGRQARCESTKWRATMSRWKRPLERPVARGIALRNDLARFKEWQWTAMATSLLRTARGRSPACKSLLRTSSSFGGRWVLSFLRREHFRQDDPDTLFTSTRMPIGLTGRRAAGNSWAPPRPTRPTMYFGNFESSHEGRRASCALARKISSISRQGTALAVYRIDPPEDDSRGPTLKLVAALAGAEPLPDGTMPKEHGNAKTGSYGPGTTSRATISRRRKKSPLLPRPKIPRIGNGRWAESQSMKRAGSGLLPTCADLRIQARSPQSGLSRRKGPTSLAILFMIGILPCLS